MKQDAGPPAVLHNSLSFQFTGKNPKDRILYKIQVSFISMPILIVTAFKGQSGGSMFLEKFSRKMYLSELISLKFVIKLEEGER